MYFQPPVNMEVFHQTESGSSMQGTTNNNQDSISKFCYILLALIYAIFLFQIRPMYLDSYIIICSR